MAETLPEIHSVLVVAIQNCPKPRRMRLRSLHSCKPGISSAWMLYDTTLRNAHRRRIRPAVALAATHLLRAGHMCDRTMFQSWGSTWAGLVFSPKSGKQWKEVLPRLCNGDYWLEHRMMVHAEQWRAGELLGNWTC